MLRLIDVTYDLMWCESLLTSMCRFHMFHHSVFASSNLFESQDSINVVNHHVIVNNEEGDARD